MNASHVPGYDIIPDLHGDIGRLRRTLEHLGYRRAEGVWRHPGGRKAAFLGDFIDLLGDKAPSAWEVDTRAVIETVCGMIHAGSAVAIMGNHELNALLYHEPGLSKTGALCDGARCGHAPGPFLRDHTAKNRGQHESFLDAYPDPAQRRWVLDWFLDLPVFLDLGGVRLVHACWDPASIAVIARRCPGARLRRADLAEVALESSAFARAVETVMKGPEVPLPEGLVFLDYGRNPRSHVRLAWWGGEGTTWRSAALSVPDLSQLPDTPVPAEHMGSLVPADQPPVLVGHYKMPGQPVLGPEATKAACLDFLETPCAYRWSTGERSLRAANLVTVPRWSDAPATLLGFVGELFTPEPEQWSTLR